MVPSTLGEFLSQLKIGPITEPADDENWSALVKRITRIGQVHAIAEEDFSYWLECFPPRRLAGADFCFAEGEEAFRLFWRQGGRYFCRQLTSAETLRFCKLAGVAGPLLSIKEGGSDA